MQIIEWWEKGILGQLKIEIGDYLIDELRNQYNLSLSFSEADAIADKCIEIAKIRYR
jgi:type I restriction enzyme R subunit